MKTTMVVLAFALFGAGCAAAPQEEEAMLVGVADHGPLPAAVQVTRNYKNCQRPDANGVYRCTNDTAEWGFNEGSFLLLADIDAWGDQKVLVENVGDADVEPFTAQGFDKTESWGTLHRGDKILVTARDQVWPVYGLFMKTNATQGGAMVNLTLR